MTAKNIFWSLIPARSGSKNIKNKNLLKINKKTLIQLAIDTSKKIKKISKTFVLTDSLSYAKRAKKYGAIVPYLRSSKTSNSNATDYQVIREFLNFFTKKKLDIPEYLLYFRPTTPLRKKQTVEKIIRYFINNKKNSDSLMSVEKMEEPVFKKFLVKKKYLKPIFKNMSIDQANLPRQNYKNSFTGNGYLDILKSQTILKKRGNIYGNKVLFFITEKTVDIDDKLDYEFAKFIAKKHVKKKS